jgi:hypothetical protein
LPSERLSRRDLSTSKLFEPSATEAQATRAQLQELADHVDLLHVHSLGHDKMDPAVMY